MKNLKTEIYFQKLRLILPTKSAKAIQMDSAVIFNRAKLWKAKIKGASSNSKMGMSSPMINLLKSTKKDNLPYYLTLSI